LWVTGGFAPGWAWGRNETFVFHNPFVVVQPASSTTTIVEVPVFLDYSRPLPLPSEEVIAMDFDSDEAPAPEDEATQQAMQHFDDARAAFRRSDYNSALRSIDAAIELMPDDATLHEFRALCLFAMGDYQEAAATIYAVLAAGPGWNWETMASLYQSTTTHTQQLRALEAHVRNNRDDSAAIFLLAYQYMTMGHLDAAVTKWERVAQLLPEDELTTQLIDAFRPTVADVAEPAIQE
jgi:tetratricopeptide (TPR) repeat protein